MKAILSEIDKGKYYIVGIEKENPPIKNNSGFCLWSFGAKHAAQERANELADYLNLKVEEKKL